MLERILTALEVTVLGLWAGAMAGFAFIFAPVAFRTVPRLDTFATLVASVIRGIGSFGTLCGGIAIVAAIVRAKAPEARATAFVRIALVGIALGANAYEVKAIIPRMEATAAQIPGTLDSVDRSDPRRAAYAAQHRSSSRVYGAAFLCVVGAVALAAFGRAQAHRRSQ